MFNIMNTNAKKGTLFITGLKASASKNRRGSYKFSQIDPL